MSMAPGRPIGSDIRLRMVDILAVLESGYGYEIHKIYCQIFTPCTREVVYYHLRTGVKLGLFSIEKMVSEKGEYSWGKTVEKIYYKLGTAAIPHLNPAIAHAVQKYKLAKELANNLLSQKLSKQAHHGKRLPS